MHDFRLFSARAKSVWFILVSRILLVDGGDQFDLPRSSRKSSRWDVRMSHSGAIYLKYTYVFLPHLIFVIEINRRLNINSSIDGDDTLLEEIRTTGEDELYLHSCDQIHVYLKDKDFSWLPFSLIELLHQVSTCSNLKIRDALNYKTKLGKPRRHASRVSFG